MRSMLLRRFIRAARSSRPAALLGFAPFASILLLSLLAAGPAHASGCNGECDNARDVVIDSAGRIVIAGGCEGAGTGEAEYRSTRYDLALWRLNDDGTPDSTFGEGGVAFGLDRDAAAAVIVARDGTLYAPSVIPDGMVISRFGQDGEPMTPILIGDEIADGSREHWAVRYWHLVAIDSGGGLVFTDATDWMTETGERLKLRRIGPDGSEDTAFGGATSGTGPHPVHSGTTPHGTGMVVDDAGRFVVAGNTRAGVTLWRFNADGTPDTDFGDAGVMTRNDTESDRDDTAGGVVIDEIGRVFVSGASYVPMTVEDSTFAVGAVTVWRFTPDGQPDESFGEDGRVRWRWPDARTTSGGSIRIDAESRIVVVGYVNGRGPGVWRFLSDGTPDDTFGEGGYLAPETYLPSTAHFVSAMDIDSLGRIVVVGHKRGREFDVVVWRLDGDGSLDRSFGTDGFVSYDRRAGFY